MGRNRTPDELKKALGTYRKDRSLQILPKSDPQGEHLDNLPRPPKLSDEEAEVYMDMAYMLSAAGLLRKEDLIILERYAVLAVINQKVKKVMDQGGGMAKVTKHRNTVKSVNYTIWLQTHKEMYQIEKDFCLTPSVRCKLNVKIEEPKKPGPIRDQKGDVFNWD